MTQTDYHLGEHIKPYLQAAGFVDIEERFDKLPWSPWKNPAADPHGHQAGYLLQRLYETGIQGWMLQPCIKLGVSESLF